MLRSLGHASCHAVVLGPGLLRSPWPLSQTDQAPGPACPHLPPPVLACSAVFAASTASKLGKHSQVYSAPDSPQTVAVYLDFAATIATGDAVALSTTPAIASRIGSRVANAGAVLLQVGCCRLRD